MALPICHKYRWEKLRAIYGTVFVRILYPFGRKYSAKTKAIPVYKFERLHSVRCFLQLSVLFCKPPKRLVTGLYIFFGWMGIITLLGIEQSRLNIHNHLCSYLTHASFPVYILHMPILVVTGFFILKLPFGVAGQFSVIVVISLIATFLIYEVVKRVPVLRFCLGIAKQEL